MKKLVVLFFAVVAIISLISFATCEIGEEYEATKSGVYVKNQENLPFENMLEYGYATEISGVSKAEIKKYIKENEIVGEFFEVEKNKIDLNQFAKDFGLVVVERIVAGGTENIYCYCALLPYRIENRKSNLQIAIRGDNLTVATPIIMGSF